MVNKDLITKERYGRTLKEIIGQYAIMINHYKVDLEFSPNDKKIIEKLEKTKEDYNILIDIYDTITDNWE